MKEDTKKALADWLSILVATPVAVWGVCLSVHSATGPFRWWTIPVVVTYFVATGIVAGLVGAGSETLALFLLDKYDSFYERWRA